MFAICGSFGCRFAEAAFAAIVAATGTWLIYWAAMSWVCNLISIAWLAWTVAALFRLENEPRWLLPSAFLVAMTLVSGTPHTDVALAICVSLFLLRTFDNGGWKACSTVLLAAIGGAMLAAPSLLPLVEYHPFSTRPMSFPVSMWSVPIDAFASLGLPVFFSPWFGWGHWEIPGLPIVYLNWAVPIILVQAWRREAHVFKDEYVKFLGLLTLVFFGLCMLPDITTIHYSFRFLPMFHLFLILLVARILTLRRLAGISGLGWDWWVVAVAVAPPVVLATGLAYAFAPVLGASDLAKAGLTGLFVGVAVALAIVTRRLQGDWSAGMLTATHVIIFLGIVSAWPTNPSVPRWHMPTTPDPEQLAVVPPGNALWLFSTLVPRDRAVTWRYRGLAPLYFGKSEINGYSSLGSSAIDQFFHFGPYGDLSADPLPHLFSIDPATGASYADLMRIESIVAEVEGQWIVAAERNVPDKWTRADLPDSVAVAFRRPPADHSLPGTLSFLPRGVTATLLSFSDRREEYTISVGPEYDGRPLVFARPWYPGYDVRLDGAAVQYQLAGNILPEVVLPAGFSGTLEIAYLPAGFLHGCLLAGVAATGLVLVALWQRRRAVPRPGLAG